ncbi:ribosomal-processing cysteine protease Prp [Anaerobranca gottschalkii]|uniref:ribosomal-processing cysteine protease Prp n=1 Tax=Anaerobranca gottschalkii TaxID=108328 RepID=UPI0015A65978|nr:ribosomal-processing cysteine protease Prp [Anaerobranca gottschalkii]
MKLKKQKECYLGYEITGHSNYSQHGEDIVCAAISALAQTTLLAIKELVTEDLTYDISSGYLKVTYPENLTEKQRADINLLTESMFLGLREIEKQYGKYLKVSIISI